MLNIFPPGAGEPCAGAPNEGGLTGMLAKPPDAAAPKPPAAGAGVLVAAPKAGGGWVGVEVPNAGGAAAGVAPKVGVGLVAAPPKLKPPPALGAAGAPPNWKTPAAGAAAAGAAAVLAAGAVPPKEKVADFCGAPN